MIAEPCDRCDVKKACATPRYRATSIIPINEICKNRLGIDTNSAQDKIIQTCNIHTSPRSREILHQRNLFPRYELQFLNLLLRNLEKRTYDVWLNSWNKKNEYCPKKTRYDALIFHRPGLNKNYALNIELDEEQHYNMAKQFEDDRIKETCFTKTYEESMTKTYIFRIRAGEDKPTSCVGKNNDKSIVTNQAQFNANMERCMKHIEKALNGRNVIRHAYIDFSENKDISEYPYKNYTDIPRPGPSNPPNPGSEKPKKTYKKRTPRPSNPDKTTSKEKTPVPGPSNSKKNSSKEKTPVPGPSNSKKNSSKERTPVPGPSNSKKNSSKERTPVPGPSRQTNSMESLTDAELLYQDAIVDGLTNDLGNLNFQDAASTSGTRKGKATVDKPRTPRTPRTPKKSTAKKPDQSQ
jgi:hypothetical protein